MMKERKGCKISVEQVVLLSGIDGIIVGLLQKQVKYIYIKQISFYKQFSFK